MAVVMGDNFEMDSVTESAAFGLPMAPSNLPKH